MSPATQVLPETLVSFVPASRPGLRGHRVLDRVRLNTNTMALVHLQGFCSFAALAELHLRFRPSSLIYDVYTMDRLP